GDVVDRYGSRRIRPGMSCTTTTSKCADHTKPAASSMPISSGANSGRRRNAPWRAGNSNRRTPTTNGYAGGRIGDENAAAARQIRAPGIPVRSGAGGGGRGGGGMGGGYEGGAGFRGWGVGIRDLGF